MQTTISNKQLFGKWQNGRYNSILLSNEASSKRYTLYSIANAHKTYSQFQHSMIRIIAIRERFCMNTHMVYRVNVFYFTIETS